MKIGVFSDSYKPYTSGVVTSISTFREELTKLGHEIYIFAPKYPDYNEEEEGVYRYYSFPSPTNHDYTLAIPVLPGMNDVIKQLKLDIIHVHTPFIMGRVGMRFAKKLKLPMLFTYHTLYDQYVHYIPIAQHLARDVALKYSISFCNHCDHVIVPSTEVENILRNHNTISPVTVIPTGVPVEKFHYGDKDWLRKNYNNIPKDNKILLFVGRLTKEKNLEFLIRAFRKIKDSMTNTTLVITAQGPLENELKNMASALELSLDSDVIFTGALPFATLVNVYHSSDLFVFSSKTETQGLVLIEAMASGLPVVAISAYGVQDMVDHNINGFLTADDQDQFADSVVKLLKDSNLYEQFSNNAIEKADSLSSAKMAIRLESIYQQVYDEHHNRSSFSKIKRAQPLP